MFIVDPGPWAVLSVELVEEGEAGTTWNLRQTSAETPGEEEMGRSGVGAENGAA